MTTVAQKVRILILALLVAATTLFGVGILLPTLPKAHADDDYQMILVAQAWADEPCTWGEANRGKIIGSHANLKIYASFLSYRDLWRVATIGIASGCPDFLDFIDPNDVPDIAPYLGLWMYSNRDGYGMNTAYRDRGNVCNTLVSQGAEAAVNSMYSTPVSPAPRPVDAKKAAIVGTMTFCPWNLGILRTYYSG